MPKVMIAPNGARLGKSDHPGVPLEIQEIVACARDCQLAGADGVHAHVRDAHGEHTLDVGLYRELLAELSLKTPELYVQITSEALGRYRPEQQRRLVETLKPPAVSVALREITRESEDALTQRFFAFCDDEDIGLQHILYDVADIDDLATLIERGVIAGDAVAVLLVLGRYTIGRHASPQDMDAPLAALRKLPLPVDWAVCAFGARETECLSAARFAGGKVRIGFENNVYNRDGTLAESNADRVRELFSG